MLKDAIRGCSETARTQKMNATVNSNRRNLQPLMYITGHYCGPLSLSFGSEPEIVFILQI